jgi:hypothetical protein
MRPYFGENTKDRKFPHLLIPIEQSIEGCRPAKTLRFLRARKFEFPSFKIQTGIVAFSRNVLRSIFPVGP